MSVPGTLAPALDHVLMLAAAVADATPPAEAPPVLASLAPLLTSLPWREGLLMASPAVGTLLLRRRPPR